MSSSFYYIGTITAYLQRYDTIFIVVNLYFSSIKKYQVKNLLENFKLSWGQPSSKVRLPLTNLTRDGQGGNCLSLTLDKHLKYHLGGV